MRYSGLIKNDFASAPGASVTLFVSGCDFHCTGCHNPEAQNYEHGQLYSFDTTIEIVEALKANRFLRNLCIMGGEPLAPRNRETVASIIRDIKNMLPGVKIYLWTGYTYEQLCDEIDFGIFPEIDLRYIINHIDCLIDGPYVEEERDVTLRMRGSRNQRILHLQEGKIIDVEE